MKKIVGILAAAALIATSVFAADVSAQVRIAGEIFAYDGTTNSYDKDGKYSPAGSFKMLRAATQSQPWWTPYITLSTSTDEAGASALFTTGGDGSTDVGIDRVNVWFKPLDMLTIKAGWQEYMMNQETIDWTSISKAAQDFGYAISYAQDAISVNLFLGTGNNGWLFQDAIAANGTTEDPSTAAVKDIYVNGAYEADFGKISAMFEFQGKGGEFVQAVAATGAFKDNYAPNDPVTPVTTHNWVWDATAGGEAAYVKGFHAQTIKFGAGYKNTIDNLTFWADVIGTSRASINKEKELPLVAAGYAKWKKEDANKNKSEVDYYKEVGVFVNKEGNSEDIFGLAVDGFVQYDMDALTLKGYVKYEIANFNNKYKNKDREWKDSLTANNNMSLGLKFRADYKLDNGITLFGAFASDNLLRKEWKNPDGKVENWDNYDSVFVSTIKAGANGSVGILSWETYLQFDTGLNTYVPENKTAKEAKDYGKWDKVKVTMPVTLTVAF